MTKMKKTTDDGGLVRLYDLMKNTAYLSFICLALLCGACGGNESILQSGKETPSATVGPTVPPFEKELAAMRTAGFEWVYLFRRADSGKMEAGDREFAKNLTADANRRVVSEDDMYIVVGMNSEIPGETMDTLLKRFAVGVYPKRLVRDTNSNSNVNK
jgi:hypothetical protein